MTVGGARHSVVVLSFLAVFIGYLDRVNISVAIIPMAEEFGWGAATRGTILSSFFVGYLALQVFGGRLADRFGGLKVLGAGVVFWSLWTVLTPFAAFGGLGLLLMTRAALGLSEGVTYPAISSLFARSIPLRERARAFGLAGSAIPLGTMTALIVTPIIATNFGWQWAFYLFGAVGVVWCAWLSRILPRQAEHPRAHPADAFDWQARGPVPWRGFFASRPVWALLICHFCSNWSLYVLLSWLPTFLNESLEVDFESVGWFSMIPNVFSFLFFIVAGNVADRLVMGGMPVGRVRKLMEAISLGGVSVALILLVRAESVWAAIAIMAAGTAAGAFAAGGLFVNPMDIAPEHSGTLSGIANTAGTVAGIVGVYVTGQILEITGSWPLVFYTAAAVSLAGMIVFLLFSSGEKLFE